jgi:amidohydrolase
MKDNILKVSKETADELGCTAEVLVEQGYPSLTNDPALTEKCIALAKECLGERNVTDVPMMMTTEDFAYYSQKIPACFYRLGTSNSEKGIKAKQHTSIFNIDENAMKIGMETMTYLTINLL